MNLLLAAILGLFAPAVPQEGPNDRYAFIDGLYKKELYELTVTESQKFLKDFPRHEHSDLVRYRMASAFFELDQPDKASEHYKVLAARKNFKFVGESWFRLGQCEMAQENFPTAAQALGKAIEIAPDYLKVPSTFLQGEAFFRLEKFEDAEKRYATVLQAKENGEYARDAAYGYAWCAFRLDNFDEAVKRIDSFVKAHGSDDAIPEMQFLKGESHLEAGRPKEALPAYRKVNKGPFRDAALRGAGFALASQNDHKGAAKEFATLLSEFPGSRFAEEAALHSGIQLLRAEANQEALKPLGLAVALAREEKAPARMAEALYWQSQAESKTGAKEKALKSLEMALTSKPGPELTERINIARGDVLFELGRESEATAAYGQSGSAYATHAAAVASLNAGRIDESIKLARTVLEKYPDSEYQSQAQLTLGEGLLRKEQTEPAMKAFIAAAKDKTDATRHSRAMSRIGWCLYLLERPAESATAFRRMLDAHPKAIESEEALFMEGRAHESAGAGEKAVTAWKSYLSAYPKGVHRDETLMGLSRLVAGDAGVAHLTELVGKHKDSALVPQALYEMAERQSGAGNPQAAVGNYRKLVNGFPQHELAPAGRYGLAWSLFELEKFADSAKELDAIVNAKAVDQELLLASLELQIWAHQKADNAKGTAASFMKFASACQDEQRVFQASQTTLLAYREKNQLEDAQKMLGAIVARFKDDELAAATYVERTYLALDMKDLDTAAKQAVEARKRSRNNAGVAEAFFFVGEAAFDSEDYEGSTKLYEIAAKTETSPVKDKAFYKQGFAYMRLEDMKGAETSFRAIAVGHKKSELFGESLFLLGEALYRQDKFSESAQFLSQLRTEVPKHQIMPKALFRLGLAQGQLGKWKESEGALAELQRIAPQFDNTIEADLWRGRALAGLENARAARQAFDRVVAGDRGILAAQARIGLGKLHMDAGSLEEALAEFLKVAVLYSHEDEVSQGLYLAGQCLEKLDDLERAMQQYSELIQKYPKSAFAKQAQARLNELPNTKRPASSQARIREK